MQKLFVSHSSQDMIFVEPFVELLKTSLSLRANQVLCTSIDGFRLPGGAGVDEQLRCKVAKCDAFVGILSPHSIESSYVIFELGARWAQKQYLLPVLAPSASSNILSGPLSGLNALRADSAGQLHQIIQELSVPLKAELEHPSAYQKHIDNVLLAGAELIEGLDKELSAAKIIVKKLDPESLHWLLKAHDDAQTWPKLYFVGAYETQEDSIAYAALTRLLDNELIETKITQTIKKENRSGERVSLHYKITTLGKLVVGLLSDSNSS